MYNLSLKQGDKLGLEVAIDSNSSEEKRERQDRWNSHNVEGFHLSPAKWGEVEIGF
jgi:hypothetical protein